MDDVTNILEELTKKGYNNIETYFNDSKELILEAEADNGDSIVITIRLDGDYDIAIFMSGGFKGNLIEIFKHGISGFDVKRMIRKS